ncbi:hypothetical protein [Desulfotignum balticum]|uniref:hypothetical protein n=1 Tax=Desulfotignum balticum TaxID=115781 RepID=UPI00040CC3DE|nr:hypothetical protein [Desulfotignum balticum]
MSIAIKEARTIKPGRADIPDPEEVKKELIAKYPAKVARKRSKQIMPNNIHALTGTTKHETLAKLEKWS